MKSPFFLLFTCRSVTTYSILKFKPETPLQLAFWSWCFLVATVTLTKTGVREVMDSAITELRAEHQSHSQQRKSFTKERNVTKKGEETVIYAVLCQCGLREACSRITNKTTWLKSDGSQAIHCLKVSLIKWQLPKREASWSSH